MGVKTVSGLQAQVEPETDVVFLLVEEVVANSRRDPLRSRLGGVFPRQRKGLASPPRWHESCETLIREAAVFASPEARRRRTGAVVQDGRHPPR